MRSAEDREYAAAQTEMLRAESERVLREQIIPFWLGMRDDDHGGFYGLLDFDLNLHKKADKGVILNSRIMYFFSEAAITLGDAALTAAAEHAYSFFMQNCLDSENGGVYWSVTYDGKPADDAKHTYNQAFAIYALSSYYALTGSKRALDTAMELFSLIESACTDDMGYLESFDRRWNLSENDKLSENNVTAYRTMNTLLHVFEGYSSLYRQTHSPRVGAAMRRILGIYKDIVFNPERRRQEVFFGKDYDSLIDLHSFGHDIESSWLIESGCALLGDEALMNEISHISDILAAEVYNCAYDGAAVCNEQENSCIDTDKIWWVQSEAVVGFINMWQKHPGEIKYLRAAVNIWNYIQNYLVDRRGNSEWFWAADNSGNPVSRFNMADPWKCPYHNGRMCLEILRRNL